eukprot:TRINITY_DN2616_c0_g1_i1.p1 TRINITY_DN2616_c0_g1~~TRINITY_DN2616_c0_g1_i1.p1  ORF type:complete len:119 (+),score=6.71 TRINITY_DN2616_c0_g1_i1:36-392(+)
MTKTISKKKYFNRLRKIKEKKRQLERKKKLEKKDTLKEPLSFLGFILMINGMTINFVKNSVLFTLSCVLNFFLPFYQIVMYPISIAFYSVTNVSIRKRKEIYVCTEIKVISNEICYIK